MRSATNSALKTPPRCDTDSRLFSKPFLRYAGGQSVLFEQGAEIGRPAVHWPSISSSADLGSRFESTRGASGGGQDELGNRVRMANQCQGAGIALDRRCLHASCHKALQLGVDGTILLRYGVP